MARLPVGITFFQNYGTIDDIDYYGVSICDVNGNNISDVRRYFVDPEKYLYRKKFLWLGSLCNMESFSFTGKAALSSEITETQVNKYKSWNSFYNLRDTSERRSTNRQEQTTYKVHSGYHSKATIDALREMLTSEFVFEDRDGRFIPVAIKPGSYNINKDGQDNWFLEFEYQYLVTNKYYTQWSALQ